MKTPLKILILEDSPIDAEIIQRLLVKEKMICEFHVTAGKAAFIKALDEFVPDVILSDHSLPKFNSIDALVAARQKLPNVPFIMVTGTVSEEFAVSIIKQGADDYILKDRLARLPTAIKAALEQRRATKEIIDYKYALDEAAIVAITDQKGIIHYANGNFCKISKYTAKELLGQDHRIINSGHHSKGFMKGLWHTIAHGNIWRGEFCNRAKDGSLYWVDSTIIPFLDDKGKPYQYLSIRYDITEKKKAQEQVKTSEEKYRTIFLKSPLPKWIYDFESLAFLEVNEAAIKHYGYTEEEFLNMTIKDIRPKEELAPLMDDITRIKNGTYIRQGYWRHQKKNGEIIIVETTAHFIDYNSRKTRMVIVNDITEKLKAQEDLSKSEENYRTIMERISDGFVAIDNNWCYTYVNKEAGEIMNRRAEELIGKHISTEFPEGIGQPFYKAYYRAMEEQQYIHLEAYYPPLDLWLENNIYPSPEGLSIFFRNITQRKKAEEALRNSELRLNEAQAITHISNYEVDLVNRVHIWSDEYYRILGIQKENATPSLNLFLSFIHPDDAEFTREKITGIFRNYENSSLNFRFIRKDNVTRHGYSEWKFEFDKNGKPVRLFGILQDITERKEAEEHLKLLEQKMLEQKIQEQKKIGRAIIKGQEKERNYIGKELHDNINQILAGTKIYLSIAAKKNEEVKEIIKYPMQLIDNSIQEIRSLCAKLVTPVKNINLHDFVSDLSLKISQDETIKTTFNYAVPDELISDDLKLNIFRIIQELANNIVKYAEAKHVGISIEARDKAVCIVVEDDGNGFDLGSKRKGIGISNIINRAETFNGTAEIITSPGNGCKTIVTIPC